MYADKRNLDNRMYNHFDETWIKLKSTESWVKDRTHSQLKQKVIDVLIGAGVCLMLIGCSLVVLCGIIKP